MAYDRNQNPDPTEFNADYNKTLVVDPLNKKDVENIAKDVALENAREIVLKGGKVLLDLSYLSISDDPTIVLSEEEFNAIINKGLIVKTPQIKGVSLLHEVIFNTLSIEDGVVIEYRENQFIKDVDDTYSISLNLSSKHIQFVTD